MVQQLKSVVTFASAVDVCVALVACVAVARKAFILFPTATGALALAKAAGYIRRTLPEVAGRR
jgi:hypothetical protein